MDDVSPPARLPVRAWLPDPRHAVRLARVAAIVWMGERIAITALLLWIAGRLGLAEHGASLHPAASLALAAVTGAVVMLDEGRRRGSVFYANLGVAPVWAWIVGAGVAAVLEAAAWTALRAVRG